ncbi:carbonyl reductase (NADPH-dependent) ari1 [Elasticomyces elasticus]|nr:carbonyl reductase (NADPH-dependent) ari1 [Elasticomyces elasticus]
MPPAETKKPASPVDVLLAPSPSFFQPLCHPLVDVVSKKVDGYFLEHWKFETERGKTKFVAAGFSRVTCLYFPKALNDRIHFACELLTVLFLIDDLLEYMSFEEGSAYNEKLIPICRGDVLPDRAIPAEYIMYDLWESMRKHDKEMADEILEPVFVFMRAQTDRARARPMALGGYFEYREKDVGKAYEKEVLAAKTAHEEGGALCSSVQIIAVEADVNIEAAKRILFAMCREWELCHKKLVAQIESNMKRDSPTLRAYMQGLEYQMSGNEL